MSIVAVTYCDGFGLRLTELRDTEPRLGEVLGIGGQDFEVRAVIVPEYWTNTGEVRSHRSALVLIGPPDRAIQ